MTRLTRTSRLLLSLSILLLAACETGGGHHLSRQISASRMREQLHPGGSINYRNSCRFSNETGYNGSSQVEIRNNRVLYLSTIINVPAAGGRCTFDGGSGFRQTRFTPSIEIVQPGGCTARIWTQGRQLTISYTRCESSCSNPRVFEKVWPVLIDMPTGHCD